MFWQKQLGIYKLSLEDSVFNSRSYYLKNEILKTTANMTAWLFLGIRNSTFVPHADVEIVL